MIKFFILLTMLFIFSANSYGYNKQDVQRLIRSGKCQTCDLSGIDLSGKKLNNIDVRKANLTGAIFRKCDLNGANLQKANLAHAKFENANLEKASFTETNLAWTRFDFANLKHSSFLKANMKETTLSGAELRNASFKGTVFIGVNTHLSYLVDAIWHDGIKCKIGSIGKCVK